MAVEHRFHRQNTIDQSHDHRFRIARTWDTRSYLIKLLFIFYSSQQPSSHFESDKNEVVVVGMYDTDWICWWERMRNTFDPKHWMICVYFVKLSNVFLWHVYTRSIVKIDQSIPRKSINYMSAPVNVYFSSSSVVLLLSCLISSHSSSMPELTKVNIHSSSSRSSTSYPFWVMSSQVNHVKLY